eukprot:9059015-Pyramimonas_sp.AAC.1
MSDQLVGALDIVDGRRLQAARQYTGDAGSFWSGLTANTVELIDEGAQRLIFTMFQGGIFLTHTALGHR